jgi:hypothetical protein
MFGWGLVLTTAAELSYKQINTNGIYLPFEKKGAAAKPFKNERELNIYDHF